MSTTPARRSKFNAQVTIVEGIRFHSKGEAARWLELQVLEREGTVRDLRRQVPFKLVVHGHHIAIYNADFVYYRRNELGEWEKIHEDHKGVRTADYQLKKKLMLAVWGIALLETGNVSKPRRKKPKKAVAPE